MEQSPLPARRKGRGTTDQPPPRFNREWREQSGENGTGDDERTAPATVVGAETARRIITRNASPDIPFDRSLNPYRGCEHGCIYCFARPTHAYLGLSPGLDFETRLFAKTNAADLLRAELAKPGYRPATLMLGANTDPYQPIERSHRITRAVLEVLAEHRHPLAIATKSALVVRDIDILAQMAAMQLVSVGISLTTLDSRLARVMEPRAAGPERRLAAMQALSEAGIPVSVLAAPMIPALNDHELERILEAAARAGASAASYILLRLPLELKDLFAGWLAAHYPDRANRVQNRLKECRRGQLYVCDWGERMEGRGPYAELLRQRFCRACRRLGLEVLGAADRRLDTSRFRVPPRSETQLSLL